ncbi:MAG: acetyl-CoA C-acyltransferase [Myxococcales bacterium]|nr:acetyl-CoA C-acyltransferase [Myxococcales bacterium]
MSHAYVVSAKRTPGGRAKKGSLRETRPEDMVKAVVQSNLAALPGLDPNQIDDFVLGCAFPEGPQGLNLARLAALHSGLPDRVPAVTVNRFCSSGVQTISQGAAAILSGWNDVVVAGGVESMTMVPMTGFHFSGHPGLATERPEAYIAMGTTAENVATRYEVSREDQDGFAVESHARAVAATKAGHFNEEIAPVDYQVLENGERKTGTLSQDELIREGTSLEVLAKLRPSFSVRGTVTPGNSSPLTDGAAAVVLMSEAGLKKTNSTPMARLVTFQVEGVAPEIMGIGPVAAIPKACEKAGIRLEDIDLIELNEAFAAQAVACVRELHLDPDKVNVNGGAIALGHPLGATGSKLTATLLHELKRRNGRYGIVSMCIGGGMGAAAIYELIQ